MKKLSVHAHFDDFEFTSAGLFTAWKEKLGDDLQARVIVSTDGRAGHHFRSPGETAALRHREQEASARAGGYEFQPLALRDSLSLGGARLMPPEPSAFARARPGCAGGETARSSQRRALPQAPEGLLRARRARARPLSRA